MGSFLDPEFVSFVKKIQVLDENHSFATAFINY